MKTVSFVSTGAVALVVACRQHEPPRSRAAPPVAAATDSSIIDTVPPPPGTHGRPPAVVVVVGAVKFPIGADDRYTDSASRLLPRPRELSVADAHDAAHGTKRLCWRTPSAFLLLDDSDFGLTTATLSKKPPEQGTDCPRLPEDPRILIGGDSYSLGTPPDRITQAALPEFKPTPTDEGDGLMREWWYAERGQGGTVRCISEYVTLVPKVRGGTLDRLGVWKSGEGWDPHNKLKPGSETDSIPSCCSTPSVSTVNRPTRASIVGDTFLLVAIGSQSTRVPVSDSAPCGFQPYLRLVIASDSQFYHVTDNQPSCFGPATDSASRWTGLWSTYRHNRDTLHLFQGDGNETFYWVSGILSMDSLIEFGDKPHRFVRIRPTVAPKDR